jgi:CRISPR/Cas system-associated exonuclease Cas4 (RecB family)
MTASPQILANRNRHIRDDNIEFFDVGHRYQIKTDPNSKYTSVTTWNSSHFDHFDPDKIISKMMSGRNWNSGNKYWGLSVEQIKKQWADNSAMVSALGTQMHYEIEVFMNQDIIPNTHSDLAASHFCTPHNPVHSTTEWGYFLEYLRDYPTKQPYRTEWLIYHEELKIAGSIDMVYKNLDGTFDIYDWKRAKSIEQEQGQWPKFSTNLIISHISDNGYGHYALQLNTYKAILEQKYGVKVRNLVLVRLHPDADTYELIPCPDLQKEVAALFQQRLDMLAGKPPAPAPKETEETEETEEFEIPMGKCLVKLPTHAQPQIAVTGCLIKLPATRK